MFIKLRYNNSQFSAFIENLSCCASLKSLRSIDTRKNCVYWMSEWGEGEKLKFNLSMKLLPCISLYLSPLHSFEYHHHQQFPFARNKLNSTISILTERRYTKILNENLFNYHRAYLHTSIQQWFFFCDTKEHPQLFAHC